MDVLIISRDDVFYWVLVCSSFGGYSININGRVKTSASYNKLTDGRRKQTASNSRTWRTTVNFIYLYSNSP